jgi:hypothetical protein
VTGPEHYQEAERLLAGAQNVMEIAPIDGLTRRECAELAQVHATLALAAATALPTTITKPSIPTAEMDSWRDVARSRGERP